jgi:hypothetical protein
MLKIPQLHIKTMDTDYLDVFFRSDQMIHRENTLHKVIMCKDHLQTQRGNKMHIQHIMGPLSP